MLVETGSRPATPELVGGRCCLDFANTLHNFGSDDPRDDLKSYSDLASWSRQAGVINEREARILLQETSRHTSLADKVLKRAKVLRDAIYRIFSSVAGERPPDQADMAALNEAIAPALSRLRIDPVAQEFTWTWSGEENLLERILWPVVFSAAGLLTSEERFRVRECGGDNCSWLFLDTSKNQSRRWCDMKVCGNRAKSRRHYLRRRALQ